MKRRAVSLLLIVVLALVSGSTYAGAIRPAPHTQTYVLASAGSETGQGTHALEQPSGARFAFAIAADVRNYAGPGTYDTPQYFRGAVEAIGALGESAFTVSPGDVDPPQGVLWTITSTLGITYTWYPVVGNHELPNAGYESSWGANLAWLNSYDYGAVNPGPTGCPTTTYSFDYQNAHFVMLNEYCDSTGDAATSGDVPDHLYNWLVADLSATTRPHVFVFGHEPAYPQPDADNGRVRHVGDSLDQDQYSAHRDRFWNLLQANGVIVYVCGHTHNYSVARINGVWQLDAGHARGRGDTGARSTFVMVYVYDDMVVFVTYRDDASGGPYTQMHSGYFLARETAFFPLVLRSYP